MSALANASLFGPDVRSHAYSVDGFFDDQLRDTLNFGLHEDVLNLLCALCMAVSMLVLTDTVFRLVVRAHGKNVSVFELYRATLLSLSTSVLHWFPDVFDHGSRTMHGHPWNAITDANDDDDTSGDTQGISTKHSVVRVRSIQFTIVFAGAVLSSAHIVLIFLATNEHATVPIDKTRMPSLSVRSNAADKQPASILIEPPTICSAQPLAGGKEGFASHASVSLCRGVESLRRNNSKVDSQTVHLALLGRDAYVGVIVGTRFFKETVYLRSSVNLDDGTMYTINQTGIGNGSAVAAALNASLKSHGLEVFEYFWPRREGVGKWTLFVKTRYAPEARVPANLRTSLAAPMFEQVHLNASNPHSVPAEDVLWTRFVVSVACGLFDFRAGGLAATKNLAGRGLEEFSGTLVRRERPWLSLVGCIGLATMISAVWGFVAFGARWQAGVEYSVQWRDQFVGVSNLKQFSNVLGRVVSPPTAGQQV